MELKLIFSYTIVVFYLTGVYAVDEICTKENEIYCSESNSCESACTYEQLINFQLNKTSCVCNVGFARNTADDCIQPKNCGTFCGANEQLDKEAIVKNISCSAYCSCKDGFYRLEKECVKCNYSSEEKARCEIFDSKTCSCTKCKNEFKYCKGGCYNNHLNCEQYDAADTCNCINCEPGYWNNEGSCIKEVANCEKYDSNGTCIACKAGNTFCHNTCVSSICKSSWQFFCSQTCQCECREGAFSCGNSCHPIINNCSSYNDLCKCEYCNPGYKVCNEHCAPFECNVNEYFIDAICDCGCKEGFFRNEEGVCTSTEIEIDVSIFYKLFLEIIYSFLPPGYGYCHYNEFYRSWALNYEETCEGPRTPDPTERCFCRNGLIRDTRTNTCMKVCPLPGNPCDTHEVYEYGPERYCKTYKSDNKTNYLDNKTKNSDNKTNNSDNTTNNSDNRTVTFTRVVNFERKVAFAEVIKNKSLIEDEEDNFEADSLPLEDAEAENKNTTEESEESPEDAGLLDFPTNSDEGSCASDPLVESPTIDSENDPDSELEDGSENSDSDECEEECSESDSLVDETVESTEISKEEEIENESCYIYSNEEFCGYHCSEGYGRFESVCKKCDD